MARDRGLELEAPETKELGPGPKENVTKGKVKPLTDYFDKLGGHKTPKTPNKKPKTPSRDVKSGGVKKNKKKTRIEEPQRSKMEAALRKFLKPPD